MNTQFIDDSLQLCKTVHSLEAVAEAETSAETIIGRLTEEELHAVLYLASSMYETEEIANILNRQSLDQLIKYAEQLAEAVELEHLTEQELENIAYMANTCLLTGEYWTEQDTVNNWIETVEFMIRQYLTGYDMANDNSFLVYNSIYDYYKDRIEAMDREQELEECRDLIKSGKSYAVRFTPKGRIIGLDLEEYADLIQGYYGGYGSVEGVENSWELPNGQTLILVR